MVVWRQAQIHAIEQATKIEHALLSKALKSQLKEITTHCLEKVKNKEQEYTPIDFDAQIKPRVIRQATNRIKTNKKSDRKNLSGKQSTTRLYLSRLKPIRR